MMKIVRHYWPIEEQEPKEIHHHGYFKELYVKMKLEGTITYETSRLNFIGRNRNLRFPKVMDDDAPLINTVGTVLDPYYL